MTDKTERHNMKIHVDKLYKDNRISELMGLGIPFEKGKLFQKDIGSLCIKDREKRLPSQIKVTSSWEDGSVRFIYARFLADLPGNSKKDFELCSENMASEKEVEEQERITIQKEDDKIKLCNGPLIFTVKDASKGLFSELVFGDKRFVEDQFIGPLVTIEKTELETLFDSFSVIEEGPVYALIEGKGRLIDKADSCKFTGEGLHFTMRIAVTLGKPYLDISYRFFNCTDGDIKPDSIVFAVNLKNGQKLDLTSPPIMGAKVDSTGCGDANTSSVNENVFITTGTGEIGSFDFGKDDENSQAINAVRSCVGKSNYKTEFKISSTGETVANRISAEQLVGEANEHFAEVFYGTFFADATNPEADLGVCATVFQAFQNFPKAVKADDKAVYVYLIPDQVTDADKTKAESVVFSSGMAREQRFLLHFHSAEEPLYELDNRSIIYQMPDTAYVDPEVFACADVFPDIFLERDKQLEDVETALIDKADAHARCYGMLNFGDGPDPGYTKQGRGGGRLVWTNNEYDYPHAMFMMYARSGIRRFLDYGKAAASHWLDVDICHYSSNPLHINGQWEHTRKHAGGSEEGNGCKGVMVCSHEWVEGLIDYYHFTGDEKAYEAAIGIGENVLRLLDTPMYQTAGESSARETGWALRTLTALYIETHDKKWTTKCEWILGQFRAWNDKYGNWLSPYTDNTTIRVGFMISVALGSLMRYYRVFPDENLKKMMLDAVDDLIENAVTPYGLFYYKELPSLSRNGNNTLLLESMCIGYELTGDEMYLEKGIKTFKKGIRPDGTSAVGDKVICEDAVLVGKGAPKTFAQSFLPLAYFYTLAVRAKKLLE